MAFLGQSSQKNELEIEEQPYNPYWSAPSGDSGTPSDSKDAYGHGALAEENVGKVRRSTRAAAGEKRDFVLPVALLCASCVLPALLGVLFYISLNFKAPHGVFFSNGTFVRPADEGVLLLGGGEDSFLTSHFTPLLLSSLSSTLVGILSPIIMSLLAYHVAAQWVRDSAPSRRDALPTPEQYHQVIELVSDASAMTFLRAGWDAVHRMRARSRRRAGVARVVWMALGGTAVVLALAWTIRILDLVLHSQLKSTIVSIQGGVPALFPGRAAIRAGCEDSIVNTCGVVNRTNEASRGGLNQSDAFRVYEYATDDVARTSSVAFLGPAVLPPNINVTSSTLVASTECAVYHPECHVDQETLQITTCAPAISQDLTEAPPILPWNALPWTKGFDTTQWEMRLQAFLTVKGNLTDPTPGHAPPYSLSSGSNLNPFTTASFGCFPNYNGIVYSDPNITFQTPFINWWTYGQGIGTTPQQLCSISICNTTVYDAQYSLLAGQLTLHADTFALANASAAVAVSGAGMFLGTGNTSFYHYGPRFLDDQLQIDLSAAGNTYGNSTAQFGAAWAQAFSNRYLGWTAGTVDLADTRAALSSPQLAIEIPVATSYLFAVLHFVYAAGILVLGVSCMLLARGVGAAAGADDVRAVHQRLSDTSVLIRDLAEQSVAAEAMVAAAATAAASSELGQASAEALKSEGSWGWDGSDGGVYADEGTRVGLRRRNDGTIGLDFQTEGRH
ncbi:hypothetical protein BDW22DRAFT_1363592 [Trametopsis cervina]|nr:hypothetical protein BDW22DRAFT_1363592 [Trametopsis cervina]